MLTGQARCLCMPGYHAVGLTCVPSFAGSCAWSTWATCTDYNGSSYYKIGVQAMCNDYTPGTYSELPCVRTGAVGWCTFQGGTTSETVTYYFPPNTAGSGEAACNGSWQNG